MTIDCDYIIVDDWGHGLRFWGGRSGWTLFVGNAHVYATRAHAESAMARNRWRFSPTAGYMTMSEAVQACAD